MTVDADCRLVSRLLFAFVLAGAGTVAQTPQLLWSNPWSNAATVPSRVWTSPVADVEAADDFNVTGTITRVIFDGNSCFSCAPASVTGVTVRFYASQGGSPGTLQAQEFLPVGVSALAINPAYPDTVDFTLQTPFTATGQHFVSMQVHFNGGGYWDVWISHNGSPSLSPLKYRDNLGSGTWGGYQQPWQPSPTNADLTFRLWGLPPAPPAPPTDPCGTWVDRATPNPAGALGARLDDVAVIAPDDVWAVGRQSASVAASTVDLTLAMHWDGIGWTIVPTPNPTAAPGLEHCILEAVDGTGPNDVWAAGTQNIVAGTGGWVGQQVLIQHWDGTQWSVMPAPMPPNTLGAGVGGAWAYDVEAIAPNDVWFAGRWIDLFPSGMTANPGLLTHYDGSSFTQMSVPIVSSTGSQMFHAIDSSSSSDVWAVGGNGNNNGGQAGSTVPVVYHWNGSQWIHMPPPTNGSFVVFHDVDVFSPSFVVVSGAYTTGVPTFAPVTFVWNGSSWSTLPPPPQYAKIHVFGPSQIYSIGASVYVWNGSAWSLAHQFGGPTNAALGGFDAQSPCEIWGVGGQFLAGQMQTYSTRIDSNRYFRTAYRQACLPNHAPATLFEASPPKIGSTFSVTISDPINTLGSASGMGASYWFVSAAPLSLGGCGVAVPFGGALGSPGEVLIDLNALAFWTGPVYTPAPGAATTHGVAIPPIPALAGVIGFTQGVMLDFTNPARMVFTNALDARMGY